MLLDPAEVIREHAAFVWRVLHYCGVREGQLEDLSQEVFLVIFRRLPEFEQRSSLRTWIYGICRHVASAARRRAHVRHEVLAGTVEPGAQPASQDADLLAKQAHACLQDALATLSERHRAVFVLFEIEELSMEEVAAATGCTLSTCYSRLYAARRKLQAQLRRGERAGFRSFAEVAE